MAEARKGYAEVAGNCPMGCGSTLFLADGGLVTCSYLYCENPAAAAQVLAETETRHVVTFSEINFTVRHPLSDRVVFDDLADCPLHNWISAMDGPPVRPGRYVAVRDGATWRFEEAG